jgi:hypothetical protein
MLLGKRHLPVLLALWTPAQAMATSCVQPWIFFDTGETLVSVPPDYKNMTNKPDMEDYLLQLEKEGYTLGLVVNVPEGWGSEIPVNDPLTKKVLYTQQFFREGWLAGAPDFPWDRFGRIEGRGRSRKFHGQAFFPARSSDRKPATCPTCAMNLAFKAAQDAGCAAVYEGEDAEEMQAAEQVGFTPFQVGHTDPTEFFLRPEKLMPYVSKYSPGQWKRGLQGH